VANNGVPVRLQTCAATPDEETTMSAQHPPLRPTRRQLLGGGIAALTAPVAAGALTAPALADPATSGPSAATAASLVVLGPALEVINVRSVEFGTLPDGRA